MAIINCPECSGKVSTTTNKCIHCGCSFVVCPECQTALLADTKVCPNCGYTFASEDATNSSDKEESIVNDSAEQTKTEDQDSADKSKTEILKCTTVYDRWKSIGYPTGAKTLNVFHTILVILEVVSLFLVIISLFTKSGELLSASVAALLISTVVSLLAESVLQYVEYKSLWRWSLANGYDLAKLHKIQVDAITEKKANVIDSSLEFAKVREENEKTNSAILYNSASANGSNIIICAVIEAVMYIAMYALIAGKLDALMFYVKINSLPSLASEFFIPFYAALGIYACKFIFSWIRKKIESIAREGIIERIEKGEEV